MIAEFKKLFSDAIKDHYNELIDSLNTVLKNITFEDNFKSSQFDLTLAVGEELEIKHKLGVIPGGYIVLKSSANSAIIDGSNEWTNQSLYIKNDGSAINSIRILILK